MSHKLREFIWPKLEPPGEEPTPPFSDKQTVTAHLESLSDSVLTEKMAHAVEAFQEEGKRLATVESKASTMIAFNGIIVALVANLAIWLFTKEIIGTILGAGGAVIIGITVLYFIRAMWFSIQTLERRSYHAVTAEDVVKEDKKSLIARYVSCTVLNYPTINSKVDSVVLAQAYLKRGIVALALLAAWIVGNYLYPMIVYGLAFLNAIFPKAST